jgi:hypothetical protein
VNVHVSGIEVFIDFMNENKTLVWYMLLLHHFQYYILLDAYQCYSFISES